MAVGTGVLVGKGVAVGAGVLVGKGVAVGVRVLVGARVTVGVGSLVGTRVTVGVGSLVGTGVTVGAGVFVVTGVAVGASVFVIGASDKALVGSEGSGFSGGLPAHPARMERGSSKKSICNVCISFRFDMEVPLFLFVIEYIFII
ncbi:MAG: hypothetical protein IJW37_03840 [Lachnospiraceae bacterium]|nr:hypothetical protein [Lachnospiraceae bacterium]